MFFGVESVMVIDNQDRPHILLYTGHFAKGDTGEEGEFHKLIYTYHDGETWKDLGGFSKGIKGIFPAPHYLCGDGTGIGYLPSIFLNVDENFDPHLGVNYSIELYPEYQDAKENLESLKK